MLTREQLLNRTDETLRQLAERIAPGSISPDAETPGIQDLEKIILAKAPKPDSGPIDDRVDQAPPPGASKASRKLKFLTYDEMVNLPACEWKIHGVLPERAKTVIFGPSDVFKSFIAIDMACSVSTGRSFHGMNVKAGPVFYCASEGGHAVGRKRIPAWMAFHKITVVER